MMKNLENVAHDAADGAARFMNMSNQTNLALIEPDAMAIWADIDLHVLEISLFQIAAAFGALHEVLAAVDLSALFIQQRPHFLDQQCILACKVFVFVAGWVVLGMAMHFRSTGF